MSEAFERINNELEEGKQAFFEKVYREVPNCVPLLHKEQLVDQLKDPVLIRNHMTGWKVEAIYKNKSIAFPLLKLNTLIPLSKWRPSKPPSLIIGWMSTSCRVIFTTNGYINFVGGYPVNELKCYMIRFIAQLREAMNALYPGCNVNYVSAGLKNRMATTALPLKNIYLLGLQERLNKLGIRNNYVVEKKKHFLTFKPFPLHAKQINMRLFPRGGVICYGKGCSLTMDIYELRMS